MELSLAMPRARGVEAVESVAVAKPARRWLALDLLRFIAVFLMVQGHTFNVLIEDSVRSQRWYGWHGYVHGFTAPIFLFSAGLAFGMTTFRRFAAHTTWTPTFRKRIHRYVLLIAIGYAMHLPGMSLAFTFQQATAADWRRFLKVDALQHIGVALLVCELLVLWLKQRRRVVVTLGILAAAVVLSGPLMWRLPVERALPMWLAGYFNDHTGSIFPLIPWAGFVFAGVLTAHFLGEASRDPAGRPLREKLAVGAAALALVAYALDHSGLELFGAHNFWKTSPYFFLWRVGLVLALLLTLCCFECWLRRRSERAGTGKLLTAIQTIGQQSLVIYVAHLLVLYGSPFRHGLHLDYGRQMNVLQASGVFVCIFAGMTALAWAWQHMHTRRPQAFGAVRHVLTILVVLMFLVRGV